MRGARSPGCSGVSSVVCPTGREPGSHPAQGARIQIRGTRVAGVQTPGSSGPTRAGLGAVLLPGSPLAPPGPGLLLPSRSVDSNQFPTLPGKPGGSGPRAGDALRSGAGCFLPASNQDPAVWEPWAEAGIRRCVRRARRQLWGIPAGGLAEDGRGQPWPRPRGVTQTPPPLGDPGCFTPGLS